MVHFVSSYLFVPFQNGSFEWSWIQSIWKFQNPLEDWRHKLKLYLPSRDSRGLLSYTISQEEPSIPAQKPGRLGNRMARRKLEKFQKENQEMPHLPNRNMHPIVLVYFQTFRMRFVQNEYKPEQCHIHMLIQSVTHSFCHLLYETLFNFRDQTQSLPLYYSHSFSHLAFFQPLCINDLLLVAHFSLQGEFKSPNPEKEEFYCDLWVRNTNWTKVEHFVEQPMRFKALGPAWSAHWDSSPFRICLALLAFLEKPFSKIASLFLSLPAHVAAMIVQAEGFSQFRYSLNQFMRKGDQIGIS